METFFFLVEVCVGTELTWKPLRLQLKYNTTTLTPFSLTRPYSAAEKHLIEI